MILEKWQDNNFSTADEDHNMIWRLQNGTVGEATGLLSPQEERAYLENNSRN